VSSLIVGSAIFWPEALAAVWWTFSSILVAVTFTFGALIKDVCESLTLILVIRPFDVGDRVIVANKRLLVVELNMLTTTFLNGSNELVWLRNSQIFSEPSGVCNLTRSVHTECGLEIELWAEESTTPNMRRLESFVRNFCDSKPQTWVPGANGAATVGADVSGVTVGVAGAGAMPGAGMIRWRFRAVHQDNLQSPSQIRLDVSRLLSALLGECVSAGLHLRRPTSEVHVKEAETQRQPGNTAPKDQ